MSRVISITAQRQYLIAVLITISATMMFSSKSLFIKFAYEYHVDTLTLLAIRMGFAMPVYFFIAIISERMHQNRIDYRQWAVISLLGITGYYIASYLDMAGLHYLSIGLERMILYTYPTFVLLISVIFLRQKISIIEIAGLVIAYAGLLVMFSQDMIEGNVDIITGALLVLFSGMALAIFITGSHYHIRAVGSVRFTSYAMMAAASAVFLHYLLSGDVEIFRQQPSVYVWGFVLSVVSTIVPSFMLAYGTRQLGARKVALVGVAGPVATVSFGSLFLGESMTALQVAGTLTVLASVTLIVFFNSKDREKQ